MQFLPSIRTLNETIFLCMPDHPRIAGHAKVALPHSEVFVYFAAVDQGEGEDIREIQQAVKTLVHAYFQVMLQSPNLFMTGDCYIREVRYKDKIA